MQKLTGGEIDTLYKLVNYGPQEDGGLPSKSGMCGLIQKGLAKKDYDNDGPNFATDKGFTEYEALFNTK